MAQRISEVADDLGVSTDTLRYYERLGLVPKVGRTSAGYRLYDDETADRLRFIRGAQRCGLRLSDIKELLEVGDRGQCPCGHTKRLVQRRLNEVNSEIRQLAEVRRQLLDLKSRNDACVTSADTWRCCISTEEGGER